MTLAQIRSSFLSFFQSNDHRIEESSQLILPNDPSIMFANAGMNQFKDIFCGRVEAQYKRATTCQKCLRAGGKHNDLENVGYTARHHTFFEMLGNFSFGDYFKEQAICYAWDFVSNQLGIPQEKLMVTVHSSDPEARDIWAKVSGLHSSKIITIDNNDNFWSMGDTGPCGPCSEIFYDYGDRVQGGPPGSPDQDGDRFVEIWNLVFMQYEQLQDGTRRKLAKQSIDTGMGLERIASVMQGVTSNYDTDTFVTIKQEIYNICGDNRQEYGAHYNVIADHIRACVFTISEGIMPSNELRGYVLRRIIRRAMRHGYVMGMRQAFLHKLVDVIIKTMSHYTDLPGLRDYIITTIETEENLFLRTIDNGMGILTKELERLGDTTKTFPPEIAYKLYDTYGFPVDLTQDILRSHNKHINLDDFSRISAEHREMSKTKWSGTGDNIIASQWLKIKEELGQDQNKFIRGGQGSIDASVLYIINEDGVAVQEAAPQSGQTVNAMLVLDKTNLYPESGGQVGDYGIIENVGRITDTKYINEVIVHSCELDGAIKVGQDVRITLNSKRRLSTSRNHTATHILHKVLQNMYGPQAMQKGSLCSDYILRFDFSCSERLDGDALTEIERRVQDVIDMAIDVNIYETSLEDARSKGVTALFGEKYKDVVRVVQIGNFSSELCGGEHVSNTSQVGCFKIISSSSVGSSVRRIEAVVADNVVRYYEDRLLRLDDAMKEKDGKIKQLTKMVEQLKSSAQDCDIRKDGYLHYVVLDGADKKQVLGLVDKYKQHTEPVCLLVFNKSQDSGTCSVCCFAKELHGDLSAKVIVGRVLDDLSLSDKIKFGGRDDMVQFGGLDIDTIETVITHTSKHTTKI